MKPPLYPAWLAPSGSVTSALIRLSLALSSRITTHAPMSQPSENEGHFTPATGRAARKRAQQLALLPYDEEAQR